MSIERVAQVLNAQTGVSGTQKLVLLGIANHDGDGGSWPSIATLARYAEVSERTVQRCIRDMAKEGIVEVIDGGGGTRETRDDRRPNMYVIHLDGVTQHVTPSETYGVTPGAPRGDIPGPNGVTSGASRGDIAVSPEPSLEPSKEPSMNHPSSLQSFGEWYAGFPKKQGKAEAMKRWAKMTADERRRAFEALPGWQEYARVCGNQYVPMASTWLNQARWEDEAPTPPRRAAPGMTAVRTGMARSQTRRAVEKLMEMPTQRKELNP